MKNIELFENDINEYIRSFIELKYFKKISLISKKYNNYYSIKKYLNLNPLYNIYYSYGYSIDLLIKYINYGIIKDFNYKTNIKLIKDITNHINEYTLKNIAINNKLYFIDIIIEVLYHSINNKYKNIIELFEKINNYKLYDLNIKEFFNITTFIINYINAPYELNFYQYNKKKKFLCKLILSIILFNIISYSNKSYSYLKKKLINIQYIKIEEFKDIIYHYETYYPKYFISYINIKLDSFKKL